MKIVVFDGYTLNPGDISWDNLVSLSDEVNIYDRTSLSLIAERGKDADAVFTNKTILMKEQLDQLPNLKYIGLLSTGINVVDLEETAKRGIFVTNVPDYSTNAVAQMTFSLLLELCNHVMEHSESVHRGEWSSNKDFCYWNLPLIELSGKTLGIIGYGKIGRAVAKIAVAFGMNILISGRTQPKEIENNQWVTLDNLLSESDVVTVHCPLNNDTKELINAVSLGKMKPTAFLINTSRGPIINEKELSEALNCGIIAGAALDVLSVEPPDINNPLINAKNCLITPHISWASKAARERLMSIAANNFKSYINGNPINIVNKLPVLPIRNL